MLSYQLSMQFCGIPVSIDFYFKNNQNIEFKYIIMKIKLIFAITVGLLFYYGKGNAQVSFKTEYIGQSAYKFMPKGDDFGVKVDDRKGSAVVYQGFANIPVYVHENDSVDPTVWGVAFGGAYALLNNKNFTDEMVSEIMDLQLGIIHMRPLNEEWFLMAGIGAGIYAPSSDFSKIRYKNVLGNVAVIAIRHLNPNMDIGGGMAINSAFGYPMAFPAFYFNWNYESKFKFNVSLSEGMVMTAKYDFNDYFNVSYAFEMGGQMALLEKDGKDVIFTHQYWATGFRPEIKLSKSGLAIPITVGINALRPAYYSNRTLIGMFEGNSDYYFSISPYASVGITYGL